MTKDHAYLYLSTFAEAKRQNEVALWRASHLENIACKQAIEESIRRGFDGMHLDRDCARSVIDNFGFKRVGWDDNQHNKYNYHHNNYLLMLIGI